MSLYFYPMEPSPLSSFLESVF
uniref:Uncharacterized protein n=1 Tax=Anguilla anguilla TaxID=7936 RepID=A0A0E9SDL8_ANGAN